MFGGLLPFSVGLWVAFNVDLWGVWVCECFLQGLGSLENVWIIEPPITAAKSFILSLILQSTSKNIKQQHHNISGRRGRVTGTEGVPGGRTAVTAEVPGLELTRYAIELRSIAHGTATFTRRYHGHEPMPTYVAEGLSAD